MAMGMLFNQYVKAIKELPNKERYEKKDLLTPSFLIQRQGDLEIYFSAHNEYINGQAKVIILGITPGWSQMEKSIRLTKNLLEQDFDMEEIYKIVKKECRFAGSMRTNLIQMLDELELHKYLLLHSCEDLFGNRDDLLHTVSLIKYPVFQHGRNYTGHQPPIQKSPFLMELAQETISTDLLPLDKPLIIALGKAVELALEPYFKNGKLNKNQCLLGFPHPSGANGHRHKQFKEAKNELRDKLCYFFT
jgi:hypothetical protein